MTCDDQNPSEPSVKPRKLLKLEDLVEITGLSGRTIQEWVRNEELPPPIELGPNSVRWVEDEVWSALMSRPRRTYKTA